MSNKSVEIAIYSGLLTVGLGAGFTGGYFFAKKKFQAIADEEIFEIKKTYHEARIKRETTLEELQARYHPDRPTDTDVKPMGPEALKDALGYVPGEFLPKENTRSFVEDPAAVTGHEIARGTSFPVDSDETDTSEEVTSNVFEREGDDAAFEQSDERPYLISAEDYANSAWDRHERVTLTYYAGDEALADEGLNLVDNVSEVIGAKALTFFGIRSEDPDIVYVRNERFGADYEVVRVETSYGDQINATPEG